VIGSDRNEPGPLLPPEERRPLDALLDQVAVAILVVDDEPPIRLFLHTGLTAQGYRVLEAASGEEELRRIRIDRPDVLILDLGLPDVDGIDIIGIVRQTTKLPIIVLSSRDNERDKVEALDFGADDYVTKPFGMDELMARIRSALRHRFHEKSEPAAFVSGDLTVDLIRRSMKVREGRSSCHPRSTTGWRAILIAQERTAPACLPQQALLAVVTLRARVQRHGRALRGKFE
jgi:DNA-binding response OmpR family regulator